MFGTSSIAWAIAAYASFASAAVFITLPVASTVCTAGQSCPIKWQDSGTAPALTAYGNCQVGLYTGSVNQQTLAQALGTVDPSKANTLTAMIPASAGPNGNFYFIRFTSANNATLQAFSAKFQLTGMTGTLSAAAQAQIDGTTVSSATSSSSASSSTSTSSSSTISHSSSTTSTAPTSKSSTSGSGSLRTSVVGVVGAVLVAMGATMPF